MGAKDAKTCTVGRFDMITMSILWCLGTTLKCLKWKARQSIAIDGFNQPNVYIFNQIWAELINIKNALKCGLVAGVRLRARVGQCRVEMHYGTVFGTLSLLTDLHRKLEKNSSPKTVPYCYSTQHRPSLYSLWSLTHKMANSLPRNSSKNGYKLLAQ